MKFFEKLRTFEYSRSMFADNERALEENSPSPSASAPNPKPNLIEERPLSVISPPQAPLAIIHRPKLKLFGDRYCKFQFNWTILGFLGKLNSGEALRSPSFSTNYRKESFRWRLCLKTYEGNIPSRLEYYGMHIEFQGPFSKSASVRAIFYFLSDSGEIVQKVNMDRRSYSDSGRSHGIECYIRADTAKHLVCEDGSANFHALLMLDEGDFASSPQLDSMRDLDKLATGSCCQSLRPSSSATASLLQKVLAGEDRYSDLTLTSSDSVTFHCHRAILGENEAFNANFVTDTDDARQRRIQLDDISATTLRELISFLYCGKVGRLADVAQGLMYAAEKYLIGDLKDVCEEELMRDLTVQNVIALLLIADSVGAETLKERCISVVLSERQTIVRSSQWSQILGRPDLMNEILLKIDEKAIFLGVVTGFEAKNW